jgi:hypothetical protein
MIRWIAVLCALVLAGCAAKLVEDDYKGPTAVVKDSYANFADGGLLGADRADFFVMSKVDGKRIDNALQRTAIMNDGAGFSLKPYSYERRVPINSMQVTLFGVIHYAAPIAELLNKTYPVERTVQFTPVAGETYVVRGKLGPNGSKVWIETAEGQRVTE